MYSNDLIETNKIICQILCVETDLRIAQTLYACLGTAV